MRAKVTISTENAPEVFICTECVYNYINPKSAQIIIKSEAETRKKYVTIGLNRDKITLYRVSESIDNRGVTYADSDSYTLFFAKGYGRETIDLGDMEFVFLADGAEVDFGETQATLSLKCYVSANGKKSLPNNLNLTCKVLSL